MQVFIDDGAPPTATYASSNDDNSAKSTYSFAGLSIGPASGDRYVIACATWRTGTGETLTGVTVDGVAATQLVNFLNSGAGVAIFALAVSSGTTATIAFTLTGNGLRAAIDVFYVTGWAGISFNSATATADPLDLSLNVPAYCAVIGIGGAANSLTTDPSVQFSWTGITEASDINYNTNGSTGRSTASDNFTVASTPLSVSADPRHTGSTRSGGIVALYN